jgi:hypothetical protein
MGTGYNPRIVTENLVFCVDAANIRSYPKTGTTWTDLKGGNNGTLTNMTSANNYISDNGGVFTFDGTDEYINVGNNSDLQITGEITVSAWIKGLAQINQGIAGKYGYSTGQRGYLLGTSDGSPYNKCVFWYQETAAVFNNGDGVYSTSVILDGDWHFVVGTFEPSVAGKIYLDGELDGTDTYDVPAAIANNTHVFEIGTYNTELARCFTGSIAGVSIYNRALSADEIRQNYLATKERYA